MLQEEATELALAVRKLIRRPNQQTYNNLIEEIGDVEIMISQIKFIFKDTSFNDSIRKSKKYKIKRLAKLLNHEK